MTRKKLIMTTVADLVLELLWEGRREDEDLPRGEIESAVESGEITVEEIVAHFEKTLKKQL